MLYEVITGAEQRRQQVGEELSGVHTVQSIGLDSAIAVANNTSIFSKELP